ncbi:MAG TPA: aminotransferase class I/II-fold pyridoxal phosphate-dependent enzyme [Ilumatobacteraceae bacterium]|nr:aminotransferase class I/II-fold pyridoxal phosphate-dependent enzyme [Ilumatobacteraceae bacterium]
MTVAFSEAIVDRSARGIAAAVGRMITRGDLAVGTRLPTVRELSKSLGVSPTTVSEAWQTLTSVGAIDARGRQGTFVRQPTGPGAPRRYRRVTEGPGHFALDLSTGTPPPALLPDVGPVVARVSRQSLTSSYLDNPVLPDLEARLRDGWPFEPEALTVVDGAMDALDRVAQVVVRLGDRVIVEHPTFPPLLDLLDELGAEVIGVDLDEDGPIVAQVVEALSRHPVAIFLQPRAHNPTGVTTTQARMDALTTALTGTNVLVIEDDHSGDIATGTLVSAGSRLPERTVHVRSYSKSHGPDLRLAAVGGAGDVVTAVSNRRLLGPGWSSRILQAVLLEMLDDAPTIQAVTMARAEYARRRQLVAEVLESRNIAVTGTDGINLWMAVADERSALVTLAARGVGAAPGEPFQVRRDAPHLRVTVGLIEHDHEHVANQLAAAAGGSRSPRGHR